MEGRGWQGLRDWPDLGGEVSGEGGQSRGFECGVHVTYRVGRGCESGSVAGFRLVAVDRFVGAVGLPARVTAPVRP
ncbi:hypothetical protein GCM10023148_19900 [Actinokineospora soli]